MIGVVLAGGASKRMGRDKSAVEVAGRPMISWVVDALATVADRILVAGRREGWNGHEGIADVEGLPGPLAGLAAALALEQPLLLVAVDQPWLRPATLAQLVSIGQTVVPVQDETRQVTCAVYYPLYADLVHKSPSLQGLFDLEAPLEVTEPVWRAWGEDGRSWFSVDRAEDIQVGIDTFGPPQRA